MTAAARLLVLFWPVNITHFVSCGWESLSRSSFWYSHWRHDWPVDLHGQLQRERIKLMEGPINIICIIRWWLVGFFFSYSPKYKCRFCFLLTSYTTDLRFLKVIYLWGFVFCWNYAELISCLAGTKTSPCEMLQGLNINNAGTHQILIAKFILAEKQLFTLSKLEFECK